MIRFDEINMVIFNDANWKPLILSVHNFKLISGCGDTTFLVEVGWGVSYHF